jgi:3-hydroxy-3-methylglutaryl CoA synthase
MTIPGYPVVRSLLGASNKLFRITGVKERVTPKKKKKKVTHDSVKKNQISYKDFRLFKSSSGNQNSKKQHIQISK